MERKGKLYLALHVVKNCCIQDTRQKSDVVKMVNFVVVFITVLPSREQRVTLFALETLAREQI